MENEAPSKRKWNEIRALMNEVCADVFGNESLRQETKDALRKLKEILKKKQTEEMAVQVDARMIGDGPIITEIRSRFEKANEDIERAAVT